MFQNLSLDATVKGKFQSCMKQGQYHWNTFIALYNDHLEEDHICLDI